MDDKYIQAVMEIVKEQELLIGPLALDLAKKSESIVFSENKQEIVIRGDPVNALGSLVGQYNMIFGRMSIEVSKQALRKTGVTFSIEELPEILK